MRVWLLTSRTYGTWLPGGDQGSVTSVRDRRPGEPDSPTRVEHDLPGQPFDGGMRGLHASAVDLAGEPVCLTRDQAVAVAAQFRETAEYRGWSLSALAVMANHFHAVVGVEGDPHPDKLLGDFKAYGSRTLNARYGVRRWWASGGSTVKLPDERAVAEGVNYVLHKQWQPLVTWPDQGEPGY